MSPPEGGGDFHKTSSATFPPGYFQSWKNTLFMTFTSYHSLFTDKIKQKPEGILPHCTGTVIKLRIFKQEYYIA